MVSPPKGKNRESEALMFSGHQFKDLEEEKIVRYVNLRMLTV